MPRLSDSIQNQAAKYSFNIWGCRPNTFQLSSIEIAQVTPGRKFNGKTF